MNVTKIKELNGFTYVKTKLPGLTTTVIYHKGCLFEVRKEFTCLECLKDVELIYTPTMTKKQAQFMDRCNHEVKCSRCLPVTDEQISGAAEQLLTVGVLH